jgi:ectoine hydroxylase-related dioxygenase (phytanoyl-CoA dioxygenase family)
MEIYQTTGIVRLANCQPLDELDRLTALVGTLVVAEAKRIGGETLEKVSALQADRLPHDGLIYLNEAGAEHMRRVVDSMQVSGLLQEMCFHPRLREASCAYVGASAPEHVALAHKFLRVDLPTRYVKEQGKFSLPWHQDSSYYNAACVKDRSVVVWIPVYDCGVDEGCLSVLPGSHGKQVKHDEVFLDTEHKKHFRVVIPDSVIGDATPLPVESLRGDVVLQHFNTIHRSGLNSTENSVRYTVLVRASNMLDPEFLI